MGTEAALLIPLGYGKWVRADRVYAILPLAGEDRGDGRRTLVHVEGLATPIVASRSDGAIVADVEVALGRAGSARGRSSVAPAQPSLF